MPSTQNMATKRLFALGASRMPHSAKPTKDLRTHGGKVKGPGTPTSDSIDAKLSKDEFVLPADTTRKVGVERLRKLVALTHKPTGKTKKPHHFADGGLVEDEQARKQAASTQAAPVAVTPTVAPAVETSSPPALGQQPAKPAREELIAQIPTEVERSVPKAQEPGMLESLKQTEIGRQVYNTAMALPGVGGIGRVPATGGMVSEGLNRLASIGSSIGNAVAAEGAVREAAAMGADYARNFNAGQVQASPAPDSASQPQVQTPPAVNETPSSSAFADAVPKATQIADGVYKHGKGQYSDSPEGMNFGGSFTGRPSNADQDRAAALAQSTNPEASYLQSQMQGADAQRSPVGMTVQAAQAAGLVGERIGYNPAYDQRLNGGGQPSAQDGSAASQMGADQNLASVTRLAPSGSMAQPNQQGALLGAKPTESWTDFTNRMIAMERGTPQGQVPQMRAPRVATSLNDWSVRKRLENMQTAASSIMNTERWGGRGASRNPAVQVYEKAMEEDTQAILNGQASMDAKALQANTQLQEEGMRQGGANRRDARRTAIDLAKLNQDGQRLGMEAQESGLRLRSLGRADALQEEVLNAKSPAQVSLARERLLALQGRSGVEHPKWKSAYDRDGNPFLFNEKTAETLTPTAAQPSAKPKEGDVVRGPDGRQYIVKDGKPVLVGGAK